jgi:hypothetical protein
VIADVGNDTPDIARHRPEGLSYAAAFYDVLPEGLGDNAHDRYLDNDQETDRPG